MTAAAEKDPNEPDTEGGGGKATTDTTDTEVPRKDEHSDCPGAPIT